MVEIVDFDTNCTAAGFHNPGEFREKGKNKANPQVMSRYATFRIVKNA